MAKKVLVAGLGVAGMATAVRLHEAGWTPVVVERAPERRTGGYFVGLFPVGEQAARRLGVLGHMHLRTPAGHRTFAVDADGRRVRSAGFLDQPGHPDGVLRGDVEAALWERVDGRIEVRFGTVPVAVGQTGNAVQVQLHDAAHDVTYSQEFDLVVGADGLRSTVRRLVFGPPEWFLRSMHAIVCAFPLSAPAPGFTGSDQVILAEPGRALWVFPFSDRTPTALFAYRTRDVDAEFRKDPVAAIEARFRGLDGGGLVPFALDELRRGPERLFDSVHQVRMRRWYDGRVVLVGDAAWCLTLYSGMGVSAGMIGADALGDELTAHPDDLPAALAGWERRMRPLVRKHQLLAYLKAQFFVPSNKPLAWARGQVVREVARRLLRNSGGREVSGRR
ncbi:FAD-dependent monooxygenase [Actinoplanes sp. NPDC049596]|uniref:FAD-dependent monooxygenase n=1 Tax=unclassified Actinoplanes TaxID=2626549 RepID=UPI00344319C7